MATKVASKALAVANGGVVRIEKKYTVPSTGIWERIRRVFAVDANRSNGIPLNAQFRNPTPGAVGPQSAYDDPTTAPAADLAENAYWQRDTRRRYPRTSVVTQADVVGLLTVGSAAAPKPDALLAGEAGARQLVALRREGEETGLAAYLEVEGARARSVVLSPEGLPPLPTGLFPGPQEKRYEMTEVNAYPPEYPCRTFQ
ncbi:MAG: hypothetical protein M1826_005693 [Phylliscum demangeonii]|nr:MAG: hypothetical protein M1826_005693 [Phylliscum demangeonii]